MLEFFGYITLFFGLYCLYSYYKARIKRDLDGFVLLPKDVDGNKMPNKDEFIRRTSTPLLVLALIITISGIIDIYSTATGRFEDLNMILYFVTVAALIWFFLLWRKWQKEFFKKK